MAGALIMKVDYSVTMAEIDQTSPKLMPDLYGGLDPRDIPTYAISDISNPNFKFLIPLLVLNFALMAWIYSLNITAH
jgi:hypothetical protein